jgi:hypothetical protein
MSEALKGVCETLSLKLVDGPETRLVAQKIIELSQRGVRDVPVDVKRVQVRIAKPQSR